MTFAFGPTSQANLAGVHPNMVELATLALSLSAQDFGFPSPNTRTAAEEAALIAAGKSHTMHSHHIPGPQGLGPIGFSGAVDAVPWNGSTFAWDWSLIYPVWHAFRKASDQLNRPITWGGVWDKLVSAYDDPQAEMQAYSAREKARKIAAGLSPTVLLDGPHYELGTN